MRAAQAGAAAMYLFDTDALTTTLKPRPPMGLIKRIQQTVPSEQFTSAITISEIVYGAHKCDRTEYHIRNLEDVLLPAVNVLDFDSKAAYVAGGLRAYLEAQGQPLMFADIQIAAIALANDLTLVTGNENHFRRVPGLRIENWLV